MAGVSLRLLCSRLQPSRGFSFPVRLVTSAVCAWFVLLFLPAIGLRKMTELAAQRRLQIGCKTRNSSSNSASHRRTARSGPIISAFGISAQHRAAAVQFASPSQSRDPSSRHSQLRSAPAVLVLILLNAVVFLFEISVGDLNDPEVLHRVGALEPYAVVAQGRILAAFYRAVFAWRFPHLLFNLFALYVLGPPLERSIGTIRFARVLPDFRACLQRGCCGFDVTAVRTSRRSSLARRAASWASSARGPDFLLRHRHAPHAKQRLGNIVMIIVIQIAFDLSTPQVSMAAHLCGLVAGFLLGLVLAPRAVSQGRYPSTQTSTNRADSRRDSCMTSPPCPTDVFSITAAVRRIGSRDLPETVRLD